MRDEPPVIATIVQQHAEEAAMLRHIRSVLVRAPHIGLLQLARLDERIAAHLDGLAVAGRHGTALCLAALERPAAGEVFALAVRALELRDSRLLGHALALVPALPEAWRGLASALGWVSAARLQGVVSGLLGAAEPTQRALGLAACRMHRVDPGAVLPPLLDDADPLVRAAALRAAGELGRIDLLEAARAAIADGAAAVALQAATACCLLGARGRVPHELASRAIAAGTAGAGALALALAAQEPEAARELVQRLAPAAQADAGQRRRLVRAVGWLGDAQFVPWLIERMAEPELARLAGEAFCWITGAELDRLELETLQAPAQPGPAPEDPQEDGIALDEDDSLPWPDVPKVQAWWQRQSAQHDAASAGQRLFEGQPPNLARALDVLRSGTQRRRAQAARWICVLQPGRPLFPVAAPAQRQRRWLAQEAAA